MSGGRWAMGCVSFGVADAIKRVRAVERGQQRGLLAGLRKWAGMVGSLSQQQVPFITGRLMRSIEYDVHAGRTPSVAIKYTAPYAGIVHEVPRPPSSTGKWKYLEDPFKLMLPQLESVVVGEMRKALRA